MAISLSTIATGRSLKPPKVIIYGVGGIGKTTWAAGAPNPIFLCTEDGLASVDVARFEPRQNDPVLRTWEELLNCCSALHTEEHEYQTVVLDSLDFAEPLLWAYTCAKHGKESIEAFGYGKGYTHAVDEARGLTRWLDALRTDRGMAVVLICHAETKKYDCPDTESYDRYRLRLHDKLAAHFHDWSDALLFANYRTVVVKDEKNFGKQRKRGVGVGERVLFAEERPAFWAKNQYGLPPEMELSWMAFQNAIALHTSPQQPTNKKKKAAKAAKE